MRTNPYLPDYYLYQKDGTWYKTDDALTKAITAHITTHKAVELPKMVFIPNWNSEGVPGAKYKAWRVNEFGERVVRWYWKVGEHSKKCCRCTPLDNGRCGVKVLCEIEWNKTGNLWSLCSMPYKASDEEAKILNSNWR